MNDIVGGGLIDITLHLLYTNFNLIILFSINSASNVSKMTTFGAMVRRNSMCKFMSRLAHKRPRHIVASSPRRRFWRWQCQPLDDHPVIRHRRSIQDQLAPVTDPDVRSVGRPTSSRAYPRVGQQSGRQNFTITNIWRYKLYFGKILN